MMRDFQGTIVEGAVAKVPEALEGIMGAGGALQPQARQTALSEEMRDILRTCHYATALGTSATFSSEGVAATLNQAEALAIPATVLSVAVDGLQRQTATICRYSNEAKECWVAGYHSVGLLAALLPPK
mmetsp:Transcript_16891/g.40725  ORF Transcript_16891/g.40725 Transcript_16891/m.40725 type:complete len:128 (-) Transcript_16891:67-450(-)